MRLSGFIATLNGAARLEMALATLRPVVDELVIGIDDATTDQSRAIAGRYADKIIDLRHQGFVEAYYQELIAACSGDWLLNLDDDETLAGDWRRTVVEKMTSFDPQVTSIGIPRRWLTPDGRGYLSSHPWFPDYQIRLFRNDPALLTIKAEVHSVIDVAGKGLLLRRQFIDHHIFRLETLEQRQRKVERYAALAGSHGAKAAFYLPEAVPYQVAALDPVGLHLD